MLCNTLVFVRLEQTLENFGAFLATVFDKFVRCRYNMIGVQTEVEAGLRVIFSHVFSCIYPNTKQKKARLVVKLLLETKNGV